MYTELQVTSNFSFLRGASHPGELVKQAARLGYRHMALTDRHSVAGVVRAHHAAKEEGIRLLVGTHIELLEQKDGIFEEATLPFSLLLYPTDKASYGRLCKLLTLGKRRAPKGQCFLGIDDLEDYAEGLICLIHLNIFHKDQAFQQNKSILDTLKPLFPDLFLTLSNNYLHRTRRWQRSVLECSVKLEIPTVITNDVAYHCPERKKLQDVLTCIRLGVTIKEAGFTLAANAERYLKPPEEMCRLFAKYPQALAYSSAIAEKLQGFSLDELRYQYPREICPQGLDPNQYLRQLTEEGIKERYPEGLPAKVRGQIEHELQLIAELDYAQYFLTVYDIVAFAKGEGILCQGRGAAANSAVCYCLGITAVNPERVDLLVERFISKERNEPPDIDIDFEHERREEVIQYIYRKYGRERAALVSEVVSYRTKSALREVGKVLGLAGDSIESLQKLASMAREETVTAKHLLAAGLDPSTPAIKDTMELAQTIHGFPRHLSQHVGGFIISETPLSETVSIENASMAHRTVIEWDKDDIELMGMLKIDCLGLGMLTCIRKALEFVNQTRKITEPGWSHQELLVHNIPPEDPKVYDMICKADTIGVFQIESRAQMSMLPRLRPRCYYDLVIEVAIIRPGPIQGGMIHPYLRRRQGKEAVTFPDEHIKSILKRTLGVPIFQEQVMELAVVGAGFTLGEADQLRRAMSSWKRNKGLMAQFGDKLIKGFCERGYSLSFAKQVFRQIHGFAEYGFPQSHAASFALLVYVSSWLKCHHPAAFAAGLINSQPMGFYRPSQIIQDAIKHGVSVLPVDINHSFWDCTLENKKLRLGMRMVKGLQQQEAEKLTKARKGSWRTITALWRDSGIKVSSLKHLAQADAYRSLGIDRQQALWHIRKLKDTPLPLFEGLTTEDKPSDLPSLSREMHVLQDYRSTGHSLKAHPLSLLRETLSRHGVKTTEQIREKLPPKRIVSVAGIVLVRQRPGTASGVCFITIEDETGLCNLVVWPDVFKQYRSAIVGTTLLLARGAIQREEGVTNIIVRELFDLSGRMDKLQKLSRDFH